MKPVMSRHHDTVNKQRLILTPATTRYSWQEDGWWCWPWQWSCWWGLCWWVQLSVRSHSSQQYFRRDWFVKIISSTPDGGRLIISSSSSSGLLFICLSCGSLTEEHFYDPIFTHNWSRLLHHQTFYISSSTAELRELNTESNKLMPYYINTNHVSPSRVTPQLFILSWSIVLVEPIRDLLPPSLCLTDACKPVQIKHHGEPKSKLNLPFTAQYITHHKISGLREWATSLSCKIIFYELRVSWTHHHFVSDVWAVRGHMCVQKLSIVVSQNTLAWSSEGNMPCK